VRKLRGGLMPPPGARQPEPGERKTFFAALENSLDAASAKSPIQDASHCTVSIGLNMPMRSHPSSVSR